MFGVCRAYDQDFLRIAYRGRYRFQEFPVDVGMTGAGASGFVMDMATIVRAAAVNDGFVDLGRGEIVQSCRPVIDPHRKMKWGAHAGTVGGVTDAINP